MTLFTRDSFRRMGVTTPTQLLERGPRVKIHRNAKTTPSMRALIVERGRRDHWRVATAAAAAGVTRRTAAKWLARHRTGGRPALEDRVVPPASVAPSNAGRAHRGHRRLAPGTTDRVGHRRPHPGPALTVARILVRTGLNRLARLTPPTPVVRYERARVGELVHLDIKPLARILRVGHRMHGDRRQIVEGAGYEYAHVAVDDHSRVAYVEVLADQCGETTAAFLRRTVRWFARRGVIVERVLTDNGSAYVSKVFHRVAQRARVH